MHKRISLESALVDALFTTLTEQDAWVLSLGSEDPDAVLTDVLRCEGQIVLRFSMTVEGSTKTPTLKHVKLLIEKS